MEHQSDEIVEKGFPCSVIIGQKVQPF